VKAIVIPDNIQLTAEEQHDIKEIVDDVPMMAGLYKYLLDKGKPGEGTAMIRSLQRFFGNDIGATKFQEFYETLGYDGLFLDALAGNE
jgi:hypothetical protein